MMSPLSVYLAEKIAAHIAAVLGGYIENPHDLEDAVAEIIEAVQAEIRWTLPV